MAHIHRELGQVDHTVSFFIIRLDRSFGDGPKLTFHRHRKSGKLMMFGGHIELNETPWQAVLHELTEETGFEHRQLRLLQAANPLIRALPGTVVHPQPLVSSTSRYPFEESHYHSDSLYVLTADGEPVGDPEEGEATEIHLLSLRELEAYPASDVMPWCLALGLTILRDLYPLYLAGSYVDLPLAAFSGELPAEPPFSQ